MIVLLSGCPKIIRISPILYVQLEDERTKKENTSPTKLPVVLEAQEPSEPKEDKKPDDEAAQGEEAKVTEFVHQFAKHLGVMKNGFVCFYIQLH